MKYKLTYYEGRRAVKLLDPPQYLELDDLRDWMLNVDDKDLRAEIKNMFRELEKDTCEINCIIPDNIVRLPAIALFRP